MSSESEGSDNYNPKNRKQKNNSSKSKQHFICNHCGLKVKKKSTIIRHISDCEIKRKRAKDLTCGWCKLRFTNRGNLTTHAYHIHGDASYRSQSQLKKALKNPTFTCEICQQSFTQKFQLTYHIRRIHFNLKAKIPYAELKKVNQVWFEKVNNTDTIMEIKKIGQNRLVMKRLGENTAIKVNNDNTKTIDLSHIYPTGTSKNQRITCDLCQKSYLKRDYKKHLEEFHYNRKKHHCNNCNRSFKRSYHYLRHVCHKVCKARGVKNTRNDEFHITSVESLSVPFVSLL